MLSIVIPTCNRNDLLSKCLECLRPLKQNLGDTSYEIIVTDDSKSNAAKDLIKQKFPWASWVEGPKRGPAANRNNGASKAVGDWLVFIDDDCLPSSNLLQEYIQATSTHSDVSVFEGRIKPDRQQRSFDEECPINEHGGYLWSCNFMIKKNLFFNVLKGFDERFPYAAMEDVDVAYRLEKLKIKVLFLKSAWVIHPWRRQNKIYRTTLNRFKSTLYFLHKHPEKKSEINSLYFLRVFYNILIKSGLSNLYKYKLRGFYSVIIQAFLNIYFSFYIALKE